MATNKKLNDGCLKIFRFIKLLYANKAYYSDVVAIFRDEINQTDNNVQVTINKYINALKIFGIKIEKVKDKYEMLSSLYSMKFDNDDLKAISILINSVKEIPDEKLPELINDFTKEIELRMGNEDKNKLKNILTSAENNYQFYYTDTKEQIRQCENICKDTHLIDILYLKNGKEVSLKSCTPKEVIYERKNVHLLVDSLTMHQTFEIPISNILSINIQPLIKKNIELNSTVVFKLKNRLAKIYKLKENEYLKEQYPDGSILVINKNEPHDKLLKRLLRYTESCEIISPQYLRNEMIELINTMIENYSK